MAITLLSVHRFLPSQRREKIGSLSGFRTSLCEQVLFNPKNTPDVDNVEIKLVNSDEQLLVADLTPSELRNVYKIDFSTMSYVKMETLGDIALLCALDQFKTDCYALSNPNRWGYESNSVYVTSLSSTVCRVFSGDDKKLKKCITLPTAEEANYFVYDWCFKHLPCEVDYSLVE
ncbi:hypothetical protein P8452_77059 [Trifolium repens]|nr:hypothetical protein P8452_77059 [Trifolium repens]